MRFIPTRLPDVLLIEPELHQDERGFLLESYSEKSFRAAGIGVEFVQDNLSFSRRGALRGLHYQLLHPQAKLIQVLTGRILDVAVDIRKGSPTFAQWVSVELSGPPFASLFVPIGFAHGWCALEDALVCYKLSDHYHPEDARGIAWNDPTLSIPWPLTDPVLGPQDRRWPVLAEAEVPA